MTRPLGIPIYRKDFPFSVHPWRTPFGTAGRPAEPLWFIYLTNRQRHRLTGLFSPCPEDWHEATQCAFETGYTQLWVLEKRYAAHPVEGQRSKARNRSPLLRPAEPHFPAAAELPRAQWPERIFIVLREPYRSGSYHDVVGGWADEEQAIEAADKFTSHHNRRSVVGRLIFDCQWH